MREPSAPQCRRGLSTLLPLLVLSELQAIQQMMLNGTCAISAVVLQAAGRSDGWET